MDHRTIFTHSLRNNVSREDDEHVQSNSRESDGGVNLGADGRKETIQRGHHHCRGKDEQHVDPELASFDVETGHEVHEDTEEEGLDCYDREVEQDTSKRDGGWAVEGIVFVTLDNGSSGDGLHQFGQLQPA